MEGGLVNWRIMYVRFVLNINNFLHKPEIQICSAVYRLLVYRHCNYNCCHNDTPERVDKEAKQGSVTMATCSDHVTVAVSIDSKFDK